MSRLNPSSHIRDTQQTRYINPMLCQRRRRWTNTGLMYRVCWTVSTFSKSSLLVGYCHGALGYSHLGLQLHSEIPEFVKSSILSFRPSSDILNPRDNSRIFVFLAFTHKHLPPQGRLLPMSQTDVGSSGPCT